MSESQHHQLSDLPLWRLIVALHDAERTAGASSGTARVLARIIHERLRDDARGGKRGSRDDREVYHHA